MRQRRQVLQGIVIAVLGQFGLAIADPKPNLAAALILAIGVTLFAYGLRGRSTFAGKWTAEGQIASPRVVFGGGRNYLLLVVGLVSLLILVFRLALGSTAAGDVILWIGGIGALTAPFVARARMPARIWSRFGWDLAFIAGLMLLFLLLNGRDLTDWYYSAIGDEYAFFNTANDVIDHGLQRPFSQRGVYGKQPMLNSAYQALVMLIFGRDMFGWKMASVLSLVIAIPGLYLLARALANRRVAIVSTMLFSLSHYLFAYAHIGYNNIHAIAPTVWALALFVVGLQKRSPLLLYAAGLTAGLGFYTYYSARAIVPIILLFVIGDAIWRRRLKELWPFGLGFVVTAAMIFVVNRAEVVTSMLGQIPGGYSEAVTGDVTGRILANASKNLFAFNVNPDQIHYVSGSLLDPVSAVLAALGFGLAVAKLRWASYRLPLLWAAVGLIATGILSPYPAVAISRLNYVVPALALLGGFAAAAIWEVMLLPGDGKVRRRLSIAAAVTLFLVVLGLNVKQFWFDTPSRFPLTRQAIAIGALGSAECDGNPENVIIVDRQAIALLKPALSSYGPETRLPQLIEPDELGLGQELQADQARCVILADLEEDLRQQLLAALQDRYPAGQTAEFASPSENHSVLIFKPGP